MNLRPRNRTSATLATLLTAALAGTPALAQHQANTSGRALDANPQVGSGGANSREGQVDYSARNRIITGNVGGGQAFQGDIDYRAPGEFQGNLGSDDLFQFRANSLPQAPGTPSVNLGGRPVVYRSYGAAPSQYMAPQAVGSTIRIAPDGGYASYNDIIRGQFYTTSTDASSYYRDQARALGFVTQDGQTLAVTATPILGIRQQQPTLELPTEVRPLETTDQPTRPSTPEERIDEEIAPDGREDTRLRAEPFRPLLSAQLIQPNQMDALVEPLDPLAQQPYGVDETGRISPTILLGRQMLGQRGEGLGPAAEQRMSRLGESLLNRAATAQEQDLRSPYRDVLTALQDGQADPSQPGMPEAGATESQRLELEEVDENAVVQAEIERMRVLDRIYGRDEEAQQPQTTEPRSDALSQLLERLDYDMAPLASLAGDEPGQVAQLMRQAEERLAEGKYFDAEGIYRQVLARRPNDPMARVGLVHAQLGAGMIRSAAVNLRQLFENHPEIIAARYAANLLPQEDRLQWLRGELERAIASGEGAAEPGLMMAYLGYQVRSPQLIRYGLATAESRAPRDPLLPVVRAIWLDPDQAGQEPQAEPEAAP